MSDGDHSLVCFLKGEVGSIQSLRAQGCRARLKLEARKGDMHGPVRRQVEQCHSGSVLCRSSTPGGSKGPKSPCVCFLADSSCRDRALLVLGSDTAKLATLTALLDPSTQFRPPLTHTSHHRPALVELSRFIAVLRRFSQPFQAFSYVRSSRLMRFFSRRFSTEC